MAGGTAAVSDRVISSLAIVKVNFDRRRSFLENFAPFLRHCLGMMDSSGAVSAPDLQEAIQREFGLELPQGVIKTMLRREERRGHVKRVNRTLWVEHEALEDVDLEADRADAQRKQKALIAAINEFAAEDFDLDWGEDHTQALLMDYLDSFSTTLLAAAITGRAISGDLHGWTGDQYVVHKFILQASVADPNSFAFLEVVVKGKMLADAAYLGKAEDEAKGSREDEGTPLSQLDVYLDGPILLHLLGHAGPELAAPYVELIELLKRQGANLRCFAESVEEARSILDVAAEKAWTGSERTRFHGDVVAYLMRQGKSASDIKMMANGLESTLLRHGIQPIDQPPVDRSLTTDETRFEQMLQNSIHYTNPHAMTTDLDALTAIHRLRKGRPAKSLVKSKAVFVTRNWDLARVSATFFEQRHPGPTIPNCVHDAAFTTLVWLNQPLAAPDLPRERIIADAYAAMNPSDQLWREFNSEIERLRQSENISEEDAHILRLGEESKRALMDETFGDDDAYTEGTALQVLDRAREGMTKEFLQRLQCEQEARKGIEEQLHDQAATAKLRARQIGKFVARVVFGVLVPVVVAGLVFGPLGPLNGGWSPLPTIIQVICTAMLLVFTFWSLWEGISLKKLAQRTASLVEGWAAGLLKRSAGQAKED